MADRPNPPAGRGAEYAGVFDASPAATFVADAATGRLLEANTSACDLLGYDRSTLVGRYLHSLLHGRGIHQDIELSLALAESEPFGLRLALSHRDGEAISVRASGRAIDWDGRPASVIFLEPASDRSAEVLSSVAALAQEAILTLDEDLVVSAANQAALDMLGVRQRDAVGVPFERFIPGPYREEYGALLLGMGISGEIPAARTNELLLLRANGEAFIASAGIARSREVGVALVIRDVTDSRMRESALEDAERRLDILTAVTPVGIVRADAEGVCLYLNAEACDVLGRTREDALGENWVAFVHPEDRRLHSIAWAKARAGGRPFEAVYRIVRPDGSARMIGMRARTEVDSDGDIRSYIGAFVDVTVTETETD